MEVKKLNILLHFLIACALFSGCAADENLDTRESSKTKKVSDSKFFKMKVTLTQRNQPGAQSSFGLTAESASTYSMTLAGCVSGYSTTIDQTITQLKIIKGDRNCTLRLTTFDFKGLTYTPSAASPFTTYAAGESALFESLADPSKKIVVTITSQISSPALNTDQVFYTFVQVSKGADQVISQDVISDSHTLMVNGSAAPRYTVKAIDFKGVSAAGAGYFAFTMECQVMLTGMDNTTSCDGILLSSLKYRLIQDTYGGILNYNQAHDLFLNDNPDARIITIPTELVAPGTGNTINGGFITKQDVNTDCLKGPDQMHLNPNMLLVIEANSDGYLYFNVDITTLQ